MAVEFGYMGNVLKNRDIGANVTLTGGVALQTKESWKEFIHKNDNEITFNGNDAELYFEEDNFDSINSNFRLNIINSNLYKNIIPLWVRLSWLII